MALGVPLARAALEVRHGWLSNIKESLAFGPRPNRPPSRSLLTYPYQTTMFQASYFRLAIAGRLRRSDIYRQNHGHHKRRVCRKRYSSNK